MVEASSLLLAYQLKSKHVLIIGGGKVASDRLKSVLPTHARISIIAPKDSLHPYIKQVLDDPPTPYAAHTTSTNDFSPFAPESTDPPVISYHPYPYPVPPSSSIRSPLETLSPDLVLTALDSPSLSESIVTSCRQLKIPVNAADLPPLCDFYFGAVINRGPLQVLISTNGGAPALSAIIRDRVNEALPKYFEDAVSKVSILRSQLKTLAPGTGGQVSKHRMRWMTRVCKTWPPEKLASLDEEAIQKLLGGWEEGEGEVPSPEEVLGGSKLGTFEKYIPSNGVLSATGAFLAGALCSTIVFWVRAR